MTLDRLHTGAATIGGSPDFDDGPWTVHGVAQAAEVTEGVSGERRYWPPETLRDAAEQLVGTPIVDPELSEHDTLTADQPDPKAIIGEVTAAAFDAEREALVYEGELDDPEYAKLAARGRIDVSPSVQLQDGDEDPDRDATRVADVLGYRDLAAVTQGAHASASIDLGTAEALARQFDAAVDGDAQADDHRGGDDDPHDDAGNGEGQSTPATDWRTTMSDDLTDNERELLAAAGQKDDPVVVEAGVRERLSDNEELLDEAEAMESPTLVEEDEHEALQERVDTVEELMAEALQERTGLSDQAVEAMPFEAMAAEFETDDGDLDVEALTQSPETGSGPSGPGDDGPSDEDLERLEGIKTKLDHAGSALPDSRVEALREEAADLADTDDYEAALEVL